MGDDNQEGGSAFGGEWTCCNDAQTLFFLFYVAFIALALATWGSLLAKPMRLMSVFLHEFSHAGACWITGGQVRGIHVYDNEGGVTKYVGGNRWCIIPAGYVGCSLCAMLFVIWSGGRKTATAAAAAFSVSLIVALCYAPNRTMVYLNLVYAVITLACIGVEWYVFTPLLQWVILFYGVFVGIYSVADIWTDTVLRAIRGSDSFACYEELGICCTPRCIGVQWFIMALLFQVLGIWVALVQMSNECEDLGWFECLHFSVFVDWDWDPPFDFEGFWDNK